MPCYYPRRAFQLKDGSISFGAVRASSRAKALELPCGQCIGCRLERSRQWAIRCMHEASLYDRNCFLTLTYDQEHLPTDLSLDKSHFQKFMKRLRRRFFASKEKPIRYFMCGEYGEAKGRPHYHAILFNYDFNDKLFYSERGGQKLYESNTLESIWGLGNCMIGSVTFESAAYVASYCTQTVTGAAADKAYRLYDSTTGETWRRQPEYAEMSRNPGIGAPWLHKYVTDIYPKGECLTRGRMGKPPRYYDNIFRRDYDKDDILYKQISERRQERAKLQQSDNTRARREVKELVVMARFKTKPRSLK